MNEWRGDWMDASNFLRPPVRDNLRARLTKGVKAMFALRPAIPTPGQILRPGSVIPTSHVLFLVGMMVIVIPVAFALDPAAAALRGQWPPLLRDLARFTTHWGKAQWVLVPTGVLFLSAWLFHRWTTMGRPWMPSLSVRVSAYLFASTGTAELLSSLLKGLFGRPRPQLVETAGMFTLSPISVDAHYLSFPSGHACAVGATCMGITLLWPRTRFIMLPAGLWLGFTRVFVGAHYPSDVIVGLVLGAYIAILMAMLFERQRLLAFAPWQGTAAKASMPV
jgi:membrane-associated phospholipid phosphatase